MAHVNCLLRILDIPDGGKSGIPPYGVPYFTGKTTIITHLAGHTYVWHSCKWNFAGPQVYLQPVKLKSQHFGVSLKFLVCN